MMKAADSYGILRLFEGETALLLERALQEDTSIREIRIRKEKPIVLEGKEGALFLRESGGFSHAPAGAAVMHTAQVDALFSKLCHYSIYSYQEQLKGCFITLQNGARVGVACEAVVKDGEITSVKEVSSLNFRIVRQVKTAAPLALAKLQEVGFPSAIIIGAPCSGKTTILREMCRLMASGYLGEYRKCCLVDERGELAAMHRGVPRFDVGLNTDILSFFSKATGILNALRTLSPAWMIADEIGSVKECESILQGLNSGVRFLVSLHAENVEQARKKEQFRLLCQSGHFGAVLCLGSGENIGKVTDFIRL